MRLADAGKFASDSTEEGLFSSLKSKLEPEGLPGIHVEKPLYPMDRFQGLDTANRSIVYRDQSGHPIGILQITLEPKTAMSPSQAAKLPYSKLLITNLQVAVTEAYQRQRIATQLYNAAEKLGFPVSKASGLEIYTKSGAAFARSRINPATGRPVPNGASPGFMNVGATTKVADSVDPQFLRNWGRYFKNAPEALWVLVNSLREATRVLGPEATDFVAEMTLRAGQIRSMLADPVREEIERSGYDINNPDPVLEDRISQLFQNFDRGTFWRGEVDLNQHGIPEQYHALVRLVDRALSNEEGFPKWLGFPGLGRYFFKKGFSRGTTPTRLWDMATGKEIDRPNTPEELRYGAAFYHRNGEGPPPDDRSIFKAFLTHADKMTNQYAAAPGEVGPNGQYQVLPGGAYEFLKQIADDPNTPVLQKDAANLIINNILRQGPSDQLSMVIKKIQKNEISNVLNQRVSAGAKHIGTVASLAETSLPDLGAAGMEVLTDPDVKIILKKYGVSSFSELERLKLGLLANDPGERQGADIGQASEKWSRAMTFWGRVRQLAREQNISIKELEAGRTDSGDEKPVRAILKAGLLELRNTRGSWSQFSGRLASANQAGAFATMLRQTKLAELERLFELTKKQDWVGLARYILVKGLYQGWTGFIDPKMANWVLANAKGMPPELQQVFQDARDGKGGILGAAQDLVGESMNINLQSSLGSSVLNPNELPGVGDALNVYDMANRDLRPFTSPDHYSDSERAAATLDLAQGPASALLPVGNMHGVAVGPNLVGRVAKAGIELSNPTETVANEVVPTNPAGAVARITLSGNRDKEKVHNAGPEHTRLVDDYKAMVANPKDKALIRSVDKQIDRFVANYPERVRHAAKLSVDVTPKEMREALVSHLRSLSQTDEGFIKPASKDWQQLIRLKRAVEETAQKGNRSLGSIYRLQLQKATKDFIRKYPHETTDSIEQHYRAVE